MRRTRLLKLTTVWVVTLCSGVASAQQQSKDQRACINALNKSAAKIGLQQGKENLSCMKDAVAGKLVGMTAQECLTADRKGKMGKKILATQDLEVKKCSGEIPDFAHTDSSTVIDGAQVGRLLSFADLFTDVADDGLVACADDKDICKCQKVGAKGTESLMKVKSNTFVKCKKQVLKDGAASAADVAKCVDDAATEGSIAADSDGKILKAVDKLAGKIADKCDEPGVTPDAFTSHASCIGLQGAALASCIDHVTSCRVCQVLNRVDDLAVDCDLFDNGLADSSCAALGLCFPTGSLCDDNNACTVNDVCTGIGCTGSQLVQGTPAAITAQITSIDGMDQVHLFVEIVTVTFQPFSLEAIDVDYKAGLALESLSSVCAPFSTNKVRCEHDMSFLATSACTGTGNYQLYLNHSCSPAVDGCSLCTDPRTIQFTLNTENWCDETTVLSCGNSQIDFAEQCDGSNLNGKDCLTQGYFGGTLACDGSCNFDTSGCQAARVFATSAAFDGDLGGLSGADGECQTLADAATLGGTWKAWLSSSTVDARERIPAVRYRTMNNVVVTSNGANLYGGGLAANIDRHESNGPVIGTVWTGTNTDGTKAADRCSDWGAASGNGTVGANTNVSLWTDNASPADCSGAQRLYCFESLPYKRVFLTSTTYTGVLGGLAGGDAKCQARANAAKLGGTWKAWLSSSTTDAKDRIPDAEYRLIDLSTVIATSKADLIDGTISNNINMDELGVLRTSFVWTGTNNLGMGTAGNCSNWASGAMNILLGRNDVLGQWSESATSGGCAANTLRLYCFEE